jgi:hypothetical protein
MALGKVRNQTRGLPRRLPLASIGLIDAPDAPQSASAVRQRLPKVCAQHMTGSQERVEINIGHGAV